MFYIGSLLEACKVFSSIKETKKEKLHPQSTKLKYSLPSMSDYLKQANKQTSESGSVIFLFSYSLCFLNVKLLQLLTQQVSEVDFITENHFAVLYWLRPWVTILTEIWVKPPLLWVAFLRLSAVPFANLISFSITGFSAALMMLFLVHQSFTRQALCLAKLFYHLFLL